MTSPNTPTDKNPLARTPRRGGPRKDHLYPRKARFLDPTSAVRFDGQQLDPTAYAGDQLLLRPTMDDSYVLEKLKEGAEDQGYDFEPDPIDSKLVSLARDAGIPMDDAQPLVIRIQLRRRHHGRPLPAPDAWPVLQRFRELMGNDPRHHALQLEHLLTTAARGLKPARYVPYAAGVTPYVAHPYVAHPYVAHPYVAHPYVAHGSWDPYAPELPSPTAEYAQPGWGGRMPVAWVGPKPARRRKRQLRGARRPVVAILDTGTGIHPWLSDKVVDRAPTCADLPIGLTKPETDIERKGVITGELTGSLDIEAGHGTFIAGLVHQRCPDARILSIRVVQPDGVVNEYDVLQALNMLWLRQELALRSGSRDQQIDVISMSLGYYHEQPADELFDPLMLAPLRALSRRGVAVVVSAGNDATSRPMYPAAFAPYPGCEQGAQSGRGSAGRRRRDKSGQFDRLVLQRRAVGACVPARCRPGQHDAHQVRRRRDGKHPGLGQRAGSCHDRSGQLPLRFRHLERYLLRRPDSGRRPRPMHEREPHAAGGPG